MTGAEEVFVKSPAFKLKKGDNVILIDGAILDFVPESLISVELEEEIEFERIGWNSIGGMKSQIESIRKKVEYPTKYKSVFKDFHLPPSKGILLYGPTGCGKTLIAKAIASSMIDAKAISKKHFIYMKGGELLSMYVGVAEARIKNAFDAARKTYKTTKIRPIIFIDEAEAILPPRGSRVSSDVETTIVPTFLSEMDGFEGDNPFVLLATNYEDRIDTAILRPGRIDLKVYVGRPTVEDSVDIFKIHLRKTKIAGDITELAKAAAKRMFSIRKLSGEISGALIESLVQSAIEWAIERKINEGDKATVSGVTKDDLIKAIDAQ
jgi:proteasome-associated ATPase